MDTDEEQGGLGMTMGLIRAKAPTGLLPNMTTSTGQKRAGKTRAAT